MKSKTPLVLMEQLIMVAVFALAAAICLKMFVHSAEISERNEAVSQAALLAQNTVEMLKASQGEAEIDIQKQTEDWNYRVEIEEQMSDVEGMGCAKVVVWGIKISADAGEEKLFEVPAAWQEVADHE